MAAVYAAHDTLLDRKVAVKVLAEYLTADDAARQRFGREARAAAGLSHRSVVTVYDVGEHDGRSFIVMELFDGGTVGDVLRRDGRIEPDRVVEWLRDGRRARSTSHTTAESCTATSSRPTSCSTTPTASRSPTSASPGSPARTRSR